MTKRKLPDDELRSVGAVYAVNAVGPRYSVLNLRVLFITVVEEARFLEDFIRNGLECSYDILITARERQDFK